MRGGVPLAFFPKARAGKLIAWIRKHERKEKKKKKKSKYLNGSISNISIVLVASVSRTSRCHKTTLCPGLTSG